MMFGLGTAPQSLSIAIARKEACPSGSVLTEQRDAYIGGDLLTAANICDFESIELKDAYLKRESLTGYILPAAAAAALLVLALVFGGNR